MLVGGKRRIRITKNHMYGFLLIIGLLMAVGYGAAILIERAAPVNPATGFHISVAGSFLFFSYPVAVTLQAMLFLAGLWMLLWGIIGSRPLIWWAFGVLGVGFLFAALNYTVSRMG